MKKLLSYILLCTVLCTALVLSAFASETMQYGYYDYNENGTVEISDALSALRDLVDNSDSDVTLIRVIRVMQGAVAGVKIAATVNSIDSTAQTATVSTEYCEKFTMPLSLFDIDVTTADADDYDGVPAVLTVHAPASKFFDSYNNDGKKIYLAQVNEKLTDTPVNAATTLYSIDALNTNAVDGSHVDDDYTTAYLELISGETVQLDSEDNSRYTNAWYPRIKKVNDDLYLLLWMYNKLGQHIYWATSSDGVTWGTTNVLWDSQKHDFKYGNEGGDLDGTTDYYHAVNADACVLDNGKVLCVFAVRGPNGYKYAEYSDYCGLYMSLGTVSASNTISWSDPEKIYYGQVWEPFVLQLSNGNIHVYYTQVAPDINQFGYDDNHRSTDTGLIISKDNGETWTPSVGAGDTNYYRAKTIYRELVGNDGTRNHYNGQMPVGVQLANGKILLAVEINDYYEGNRYRISYATSNANGVWTDLGGINESGTGKEGTYTNLTDVYNSSPYVDRFPSGEVFMTNNYGSKLLGRLVAPNGESFGDTFECAPDCTGIWGACDVVDSHKVAVAMQNKITTETDENGKETAYVSGINLYYYYLNHRINAKEISVVVDGYDNEWGNNTDALFVGSDTQAQASFQVAHDKDNVYFLISRLDKYLNNGSDTATIYIAAGDTSYYTITCKLSGKYTITHTSGETVTNVTSSGSAISKILGTTNYYTDVDNGAYIELSIPKSEIGAANKTSLKVLPAIQNKDSATGEVTTDTLMNADMTSTAKWIEVVLDD